MMPRDEYVKMLNVIRQEYGLPLLSEDDEMAEPEEFLRDEAISTRQEPGGTEHATPLCLFDSPIPNAETLPNLQHAGFPTIS